MTYALFWKRLLVKPMQFAALAPRSRALALAMQSDLALEPGALVVELGCGTGAMTRELDVLCRERHWRYLGVELDEALCAHLGRRFPEREIVCRTAEDLPELLARRALPSAAAVISSLPLAAMDDDAQARMLRAIAASLRPDGVLRHFTYQHYQWSAGAQRLRRWLHQRFAVVRVHAHVARNLPPALVLAAEGPR